GFFPFGDDHVLDANRDTSASRFGKPELFQFVQRGNRNCGAGDLIAAPNDVAELLLARWFVEETKFFRLNLIKDDAPVSFLDHRGVWISKVSLSPAIGVLEQNPIMRFNRAFDHREF